MEQVEDNGDIFENNDEQEKVEQIEDNGDILENNDEYVDETELVKKKYSRKEKNEIQHTQIKKSWFSQFTSWYWSQRNSRNCIINFNGFWCCD